MSITSARAQPLAEPPTSPGRRIIYKVAGQPHGPSTILIDLDGLARMLKPFVLLNLFRKDGPEARIGLHPHSGIATLTYVVAGETVYTDPSGQSGTLGEGSVEWMKVGRGMWHTGGFEAGASIGIQLWIALPASLELTPYQSSYIRAEMIETAGPAHILLGQHNGAKSRIDIDLPVNVFAVHLAAGEAWTFIPRASHRVLWVAVATGILSMPDRLSAGDLAVFDDTPAPVTFVAESPCVLMLGSSTPHPYDLVMRRNSIHTSQAALAEGERHIAQLGASVRAR